MGMRIVTLDMTNFPELLTRREFDKNLDPSKLASTWPASTALGHHLRVVLSRLRQCIKATLLAAHKELVTTLRPDYHFSKHSFMMSKHSGSAKTGLRNAWKRLSPGQLNIAIQLFSLISIFFEGYDQGVMGGVNAAPDYVRVVNIGQYPSGTVTNQTKQGGIISIYYLGALVGCFLGGWAADRIGRINGLSVKATSLFWAPQISLLSSIVRRYPGGRVPGASGIGDQERGLFCKTPLTSFRSKADFSTFDLDSVLLSLR
ncbi:hypothetical protein LTS16_023826 [Friedmanniomyces endolithicus]|nr:hypothetical protein LTS16_023826 [Friedmanniomyces endolithicus]